MSDFAIKLTDGKAAIYTPYNKTFVEKIKLMGARWNASDRCWVIDEYSVPDARAAMREVYGRDDLPVSETVDVELTFERSVYGYKEPVTILGRTIASAYGRDSGARIGDGVMFLEGKPHSGGSVKNWETVVPEGCVVKLPKLPKMATEAADLPDGVTMRILGEGIDRSALEEEKAKLLARIAVIDAILNA